MISLIKEIVTSVVLLTIIAIQFYIIYDLVKRIKNTGTKDVKKSADQLLQDQEKLKANQKALKKEMNLINKLG